MQDRAVIGMVNVTVTSITVMQADKWVAKMRPYVWISVGAVTKRTPVQLPGGVRGTMFLLTSASLIPRWQPLLPGAIAGAGAAGAGSVDFMDAAVGW